MGLDAVFDAVESGEHHGSEAQVGVAGRVGGAEFNAFCLGVGTGDGDAHSCGAVALGVHQVDGRFVSGHQAVVRVERGVGERHHGTGVVQNAADVVARHVGKPGVAGFVVEEGCAVFPEALVGVHAGPVVACDGFGHEGDGFAVLNCRVFDDVFEGLQVVGGVEHGVEPIVDFLLTAGTHFVVEAFDLET